MDFFRIQASPQRHLSASFGRTMQLGQVYHCLDAHRLRSCSNLSNPIPAGVLFTHFHCFRLVCNVV